MPLPVALLLGGGIGAGLGTLGGLTSAAVDKARQALRRETVTAERTAAEVAATREAERGATR